VTPRVALLIFAVIVGAGILAAAPVLTGAKNRRPEGGDE
jgi:hypothetical protein